MIYGCAFPSKNCLNIFWGKKTQILIDIFLFLLIFFGGRTVGCKNITFSIHVIGTRCVECRNLIPLIGHSN